MSPKPTVAILGAGAGGIAMGIALKRAGFEFTDNDEEPESAGAMCSGNIGATPTKLTDAASARKLSLWTSENS